MSTIDKVLSLSVILLNHLFSCFLHHHCLQIPYITNFIIENVCSYLLNYRNFAIKLDRDRGGGGQKTKWKTPSSNFEELIESITNMLLFFAGGSRKKSYEVSKFWGGGGGGGSMP